MNAPISSSPYERLHDLPHGSAEWHAARRLSIGASEIAIVLGESPWRSRLDLYYEKTSDQPREHEDSEHMLWGRLLEGAILDEVARRAGVEVTLRGPSLRSVAHPWATATPDGLTAAGEPVEVKNLSGGYDADDWDAGIPRHYYLQCQHQMMVTGARRCLFAALVWGRKLVWEWVPRDDDEIRRIVVAGSEFWRRVTELDEPPPDGHPRERGALAARATEDAEVELYVDDVEPYLFEWESFKAQQRDLEKELKETKAKVASCENQIAQAMGPAQRAFCASGWTFRWKRTPRKGYTVEPTVVTTFEIKEKKR